MGIELSFAERRVLGVLIEKGFTTPEGYPLTLNGVVVASNQKTCRDPVTSLDENEVLESLESLRAKGFAVLVRAEGSRADRWKHRAAERLEVEPKELAILAELLVRGPQTDGELRQRATRMVSLGELEEVDRILAGLASRPEPLVERLSAPEKRRGARYAHTLYPPSEMPEGARESGGALHSAAPAAQAAPGVPEPASTPPAGNGRPLGAPPAL
ncbi:MAG: DUF480 domain-containing protein, partial [Planctomycetota bacterium]